MDMNTTWTLYPVFYSPIMSGNFCAVHEQKSPGHVQPVILAEEGGDQLVLIDYYDESQ
jgi:hypothetical protein